MSNVFVLGSGFSKSYGLPVLAELFNEMLRIPGANRQDIMQVKEALEFLYPHLKTQDGQDGYPPFEEFLSLVTASKDLESSEEGDCAPYPKGEWEKREKSALHLLTECLDAKSNEAQGTNGKANKRFVESVMPGDTVITFNWDTLIERYLWAANKEFVFGPSDQSKISLLKLHGSLSWVWLPHPPLNQSPFQPPKGWVRLDHSDKRGNLYCIDNPFLGCLGEKLHELNVRFPEALPYIVPPIWHKTPLNCFVFEKMWHQAYNALATVTDNQVDQASTDKITVIGYSLPPEDLHARGLLRVALRHKSGQEGAIHLIDPNPDVAGRFFTTVTKNLDYHRTHFTADKVEQIISSKNSL